MTSEGELPFKDLSDRLVKALHLERRPVGVLWTTEKPEGIQRTPKTLKGCQFLDVARLEDKLFYTDIENHSDCKNGSHYLGFTPRFEGQGCGTRSGENQQPAAAVHVLRQGRGHARRQRVAAAQDHGVCRLQVLGRGAALRHVAHADP